MGRIIGIDLGTTTSEIAFIKDGKPEIIYNDMGGRITPSVVSINYSGELIVGDLAKRQVVLMPERSVIEIKRKMGTNEKIRLGDKSYLPEEISSFMLRKLKEYAEAYLGEEVNEAVITVPANFNDLQRRATKKAGEMAGLKVERIINEPTAAALAYGINNLDNEEKVLVYDLGGGTFDVTVLELFSGVLDIKSSRGNNQLGGKDFDEILVKYIIDEFKKKHDINLKNNIKSMARIKEAAEKAKIELSSLQSTEIDVPFIAIDENQNPLEVNIKLTRKMFEDMISDLIESTGITINDALEAAGYKAEEITVVIAVGGSSRIPLVKKLLNSKFPGKVKSDINQDEAVALGAAIQAGIKNDEISSESSVLIADICNHTFGISTISEVGNGRWMDGVFDPLIERDTKIPCTVKKDYYTSYDNQTSVRIEVYQGVGRLVIENTKIGELVLEGIPEAEEGKETIEVAFSYNLNGMLEVLARINSTGKEMKAIFDMAGSNNDKAIAPNLNAWRDCQLAYKAKSTIELAEKKITKISDENRNKVLHLLNELKKAVLDNNEVLVDKYDDELTNLLFDI